NYALRIIDKFSLPQEVVQSPEVQQAAKEGLIYCLSNSNGTIDDALNIISKFSLPQEVVQSLEVQQLAKKVLINCLSNGSIDYALRIIDTFNLPEEFIQQAAKKGLINCLSEGGIDDALELIKTFSINISSQEIIEQIPKLNNLLEKTQVISPEFYSQALKSTDIVITLCGFQDNQEQFLQEIQENPFLLDAVSENPRFGSKLLIKYLQFDELSKENIQTLFDAKKEIMTNNPDIDPESLEFRRLMQEKLKEYKNNPEILDALEKSGIDANEWLNYSETSYFNLVSGESHLAFSETLSAPINRIKETLDSYAHTLKETLKEYRPELSEFKIPLEDAKEIEEKIAQMQTELEKAQAEGNDRKAQGIEKGIEGLKKKTENIKTVALWDKLLGDISAFQQLKNDVFGTQKKLMRAEDDLTEKISGKLPSGRMIQELKEKINKAKEELRNKFGILERRIEDFRNNLSDLIAPCLSEDRAKALIQEIELKLAEQFDHYNADRSTLTNLFSERNDKQKERMESQPMSIFVWARNPDIDLYQGNYSPCCICIDSEHMGAESTIADYNTDLGVQIVNIWDEVKNEPVTAAWCWLGASENNEPVLVVDNIESNTMYSANYSEQLTKELFDYLKDYAKAIGAKKIVLGKANNDLPTAGELAKMKETDSKYEKIGGYNRDDGYFLEAEDKSVKLLWKEEQPTKEKLPKKKIIVPKEEFKDTNINNLTEKDFATIKQLERKIYAGTDLISGQAMIEDIKQGNGLEYSIIMTGKRAGGNEEIIGYIAAMEDETDEGDKSIYLEDIAVLPEAQGQGIGWEMFKGLINKLKEKSRKENKPILLDMHLREESQRLLERHREELEQMGVKLIEEALVLDYYDNDEDALYKVYQIKAD
ncbi:MAG: GNAT family N-acetyltransferase, partial [Patescibacteria group bacterium]